GELFISTALAFCRAGARAKNLAGSSYLQQIDLDSGRGGDWENTLAGRIYRGTVRRYDCFARGRARIGTKLAVSTRYGGAAQVVSRTRMANPCARTWTCTPMVGGT